MVSKNIITIIQNLVFQSHSTQNTALKFLLEQQSSLPDIAISYQKRAKYTAVFVTEIIVKIKIYYKPFIAIRTILGSLDLFFGSSAFVSALISYSGTERFHMLPKPPNEIRGFSPSIATVVPFAHTPNSSEASTVSPVLKLFILEICMEDFHNKS